MNGRAKALGLSWLWALVPLWSLGFGTGAIMVHAAVKKKSILQAASVPLYLVAMVLVLGLDPDKGGSQEVLFGLGMTANMGIGFIHAVGIRSWVFADVLVKPDLLRRRQAQAVANLREQAKAREAARRFAADQPVEARRLFIGRPDVPGRQYPDGGLVDVNQVSAAVLAKHLSISTGCARRIIAVRDRVGGFSSYEDLLLLTDLDPRELDLVAELMLFTQLHW